MIKNKLEARRYNIDAVHCIDCTAAGLKGRKRLLGSMSSFNRQIASVVRGSGQVLDTFRSSLILYYDFWTDTDAQIIETRFADVATEWRAVTGVVSKVRSDAECRGPSSGLEALSIALDAKWLGEVDKGRRLIFVWSSSPSHPLERAQSELPPLYYRSGRFATDFVSLCRAWDYMAASSRGSIILMCPDVYPWSRISKEWANVVHLPSNSGRGLTQDAISQVVDAAVLQFQD
jgi:hypothetical protein